MTFRKFILTITIATAPVLVLGQGQTSSTPSNFLRTQLYLRSWFDRYSSKAGGVPISDR